MVLHCRCTSHLYGFQNTIPMYGHRGSSSVFWQTLLHMSVWTPALTEMACCLMGKPLTQEDLDNRQERGAECFDMVLLVHNLQHTYYTYIVLTEHLSRIASGSLMVGIPINLVPRLISPGLARLYTHTLLPPHTQNL